MCVDLGFPCTLRFWLGCWGKWPLARASSVSRHPLVGLPVAWSCAGVLVGGVSLPPFFFFSGCGGDVCGSSSLLAAPCPGLGPLGLRPPFPFRLGCVCCFLFAVARQSSGGVYAGVSGVSFSPALRRSCGPRGLLLLAGCRQVGQAGPPVFFWGGPWVSPLRVAWLAGVARRSCSGCAPLRLSDCLCPTLFFSPVGARSWLGGGSPLHWFFFWGWFTCSSLCLPLAGPRTGQHSMWLTRLLLVLQFAAGRVPAPWVGWVMSTLGLAACSVGLRSGFAGWADVPAGLVRSWIKGGLGCPRPPALAVPVVTFWWRFVGAGRRR